MIYLLVAVIICLIILFFVLRKLLREYWSMKACLITMLFHLSFNDDCNKTFQDNLVSYLESNQFKDGSETYPLLCHFVEAVARVRYRPANVMLEVQRQVERQMSDRLNNVKSK